MDNRTPDTSPALTDRSEHYPFGNKVPRKVIMLKTVRPDFPFLCNAIADFDTVYECWVNRHGAVSVITTNGLLGLKPDEFDVVEWHTET